MRKKVKNIQHKSYTNKKREEINKTFKNERERERETNKKKNKKTIYV